MKSNKERFEEFYDTCKDKIDLLRTKELNDYQKTKNKLITKIFIMVIIILGFLYFIHTHNANKYYEITIAILLFVLITGIMIFNIRLINDENKISSYVINTVIYEFILKYLTEENCSFEYNTEIAEEDFSKMNIFNMNYLMYSGNNLTKAIYNKKRLVMSDVWLYDLIERIKTDTYYSKAKNTTYITNYHYHEKIDIFKGLYYETTINRDNNEYIYMIPNNFNDKFVQKNIYHYIYYKGNKVELENLEFSKRYSVFSLDEIKSRYILSLTLMEKINKIDQIINNKKYFVFKSDGRVGIFIDGIQLDNIFSKKIKLNKEISKSYVNNMFITIKKLLDISQILEDINPYE